MRFLPSLALVATLLSSTVTAQSCINDGGNWFCDEVKAIQYSNFGGSGVYSKVVNMDEATGQCTFANRSYSGILAPFNEQLSIHIRGPFNLKQFAWYRPIGAKGIKQRRNAPSRLEPEDDDTVELDERDVGPITWSRQGYYSSSAGTAENITFLNNMGGGAFPGIWSPTFGNSLGYASATGTEPAMAPTVLQDTVLPSTSEISIWTDKVCGPGSPCPYSRPQSVAHQGFGGHKKIFFFEFAMPHAPGQDMPALWFLNARIPRTQQYGACSCWGNTHGCGELDAFEVLAPGDERMISAVHSVQAATDPNYFARPCGGTVKASVAFQDSKVVLKILPDDADFSSGLTAARVNKLMNMPANKSNEFVLSG